MKILYPVFLLLLSSAIFGQATDTTKVVINGGCFGRRPIPQQLSATAKKDTAKSETRMIMRCRNISGNSQPLIVLDGNICDNNCINKLQPQDIDSICVIKGAKAMALFGIEGQNGALVITTKKTIPYKLFIKDKTDGNPVPGATVVFTKKSNKARINFVTNDSGYITGKDLPHTSDYTITVSAVGYAAYTDGYNYKPGTGQQGIWLEREYKLNEVVILQYTRLPKRTGCPIGGIYSPVKPVQLINGNNDTTYRVNVFPNPLVKGGVLNLKTDKSAEGPVKIVIREAGGKELLRKDMTNRTEHGVALQIKTDPRWPAGIYFLQVCCENGRILASEKIIIQ